MADEPIEVQLEEGKNYAWCTCAKSGKQPLCDGSHKGSDDKPLLFKVDKAGPGWLCVCKQSKTPPYCDGTHALIAEGG